MEKYGFVYIWFDRKYKRYYIGSHWGHENDGYICSSPWMQNSYRQRKTDFKRRIIKRIYTNRIDLLDEEQRWLNMIDEKKLATVNTTTKKRETIRYYNLTIIAKRSWHYDEERRKTVGNYISASKTGKKTGPRPEAGPVISAAKKGKPLTEEHKAALRGIKKKPHTNEWKAENSRRVKEQWASGVRKSSGPITDEHKSKISQGNRGKKLDPDHVSLIKENVSKDYSITYIDGSIRHVHGLKQFGRDESIPYVTLHKAFRDGSGIKKYSILKIDKI